MDVSNLSVTIKIEISVVAYGPQGGYRILKGAGPRGNVGQKARMNFATWDTFYAKFAPIWALFP